MAQPAQCILVFIFTHPCVQLGFSVHLGSDKPGPIRRPFWPPQLSTECDDRTSLCSPRNLLVNFSVLCINCTLERSAVVAPGHDYRCHRFSRHFSGLHQDLPTTEETTGPHTSPSSRATEKKLAKHGEVQEDSIRHDVGLRDFCHLLPALLYRGFDYRCQTHASNHVHPELQLHSPASELVFEPFHLLHAAA